MSGGEASHALRARIGICRLLLAQGTRGDSRHRLNSRTQRHALIADIANCTVTRQESPALQQACDEVQWACSLDRRSVLDALIAATAKKSRRGMQNYMALVDFLLRIDWQHLHAEHQVTMKPFRTECAASSGQKCITYIAVAR